MLNLPLLLMPNSKWAAYGEGFAERIRRRHVAPKDREGAVIHDPVLAAEQGVSLALRADLHTICVHGDSPNAVSVAKKFVVDWKRLGLSSGILPVTWIGCVLVREAALAHWALAVRSESHKNRGVHGAPPALFAGAAPACLRQKL